MSAISIMGSFSPPASITVPNAELLDLLAPSTGPITDLVLAPMEEPGMFAFSAISKATGDMIDGAFKLRCRWSDHDLLIDLAVEIDGG